MKTMYGRQFATMAGMILLSFLMLGASFATLSYQYTIQEKRDSMSRSANIIAAYTSDYINANGEYSWLDLGFQGQLSVLALVADTHVMVSTAQGVVVYATDGAKELLELENRSIPTQIVSEVIGGSFAGATTLGGMYEKPRYLVALPIQSGATLQGLVLVSCEASEISSMWEDLSGIFLVTAAAVILIAAIISSVTSMRQSKPIKEIAAAARQFGHGELNVRVDVGHRRDEVGELAEAFNAMADSLAKSEQRRSEFIANVSHELKTPMTTIAGFADGILDGTIPPEKEREYLQVISSETRRLSRLVRSMLDLSRLQSDERAAQQQFDISETMLRVLVSLESKINAKHLNVDTRLPDGPVQVWGDQDAITQVCYNLLDNATKFSPENGPLSIFITTKGSKAYISIRNEGETIAPEELPLIFDRFHKTDHSRSADRDGVGLGLYIVKTILNSHKENITCTSEDGKTTFTFTLTLA
ncbi:MAG TPA: HAMP domain-containing histidine kinase [Candidatus Enterenecus stercoripullorum]|nr:HAMP domain-containing histidine kinase [Candidatus Enterenecus stercoripullorum]